MDEGYDFKEKDPYWSQKWVEDELYKTEDGTPREDNVFVLDMFPYPSGTGLHVGHPMGYVGTDIFSRMKRMQGKNVLHPMGYDAFGLPAEQHAMKTGEHPSVAVESAVVNFRKAMQDLGLSYDWSREINTTDPEYYKWTQWIFGKLFERGLAYMDNVEVNWCPALGTVLANEEIVDGVSERGGHPVERKPMKQWVLKITKYAERLLDDLDLVDWPDNVKEMQRNWIGKSEGLKLKFDVEGQPLEVFTTKPETLFGVTFIALAPEHPLISKITKEEKRDEVNAYVDTAKNVGDRDRQIKEKTGVFTGSYAKNPLTGEQIEIWIGDYVLSHYGHGAVMGVPNADERDEAFAKKYKIPVREIFKGDISKYDDGAMVNSGFLDGLKPAEARKAIVENAEQEGYGEKQTNYKLRDWIFSRQRYWGEPFPIIHRPDGEVALIDTSKEAVTLPKLTDYKPSGKPEPMLERATEWVNTADGRRETNTMPQWAGSCWYYLRYIDPNNQDQFAAPEKLKEWLPVDLYVGGTEHAVLHLLYSRFWHKVLYDAGLVPTPEPFKKLINQGMILGEDGEKMSKSKGNTVPVADVVKEHGADAFRTYEMFLGGFGLNKAWSTEGIAGIKRWLERVWNVFQKVEPECQMEEKDKAEIQTFIKGVTDDIVNFKFNTAISKLMVLTNKLTKSDKIPQELAEIFCKLLAPFAPMISEEIWCNLLNNQYSVHKQEWPEYDATLAALKVITIAVQVNGKLRGTIEMDSLEAQDREVIIERARTHESVAKYLEGQEIAKEIFVPGKVVNFVTKDKAKT